MLFLAGAGCGAGEDLIAPVSGSLTITVHTSGSALDPDGYGIRVDGGDVGVVSPTGSAIVPELTPGEHVVEIVNVAPTCSLADPNPRSVSIPARSTLRITFRIVCSAPPEYGHLQVAVTTTGPDPDPDGYVAVIDPSDTQPLAANDAVVFDSVLAGPNQVRLAGVADNCILSASPDTVTVSPSDTARSTFEVTCWPPLVGRIAFSRRGDIFLQQADGTELRQLTGHGDTDDEGDPLAETDNQPAWSPDGTRLAFARDLTLFVTDAIGSNTARLTPDTLTASQQFPKWSPDGQKLLFLGDRGEGGGSLYVINSDGTGLTRFPPEGVLSASWSPDGRRLAAVFMPQCCTQIPSLVLMDPEGTNMVDITPTGPPFIVDAVEWSPDGSSLALVTGNIFAGSIFISDTLGTSFEAVVVTSNSGVRSAAWSPDGMRLAFPMLIPGASVDSEGIFVVNRDGTGLVQLTGMHQDPFAESSVSDANPSWGP